MKINILLILCLLALGGCNSNSEGANKSSITQSDTTVRNINKVPRVKITTEKYLSKQMRGANSYKSIDNPGVIGWNSVLNIPARQACFNFNLTEIPDTDKNTQGTTISSVSEDLANKLDFNLKLYTFDFEGAANISFTNSFGMSKSFANGFASSSIIYEVNDVSLNSTGQSFLKQGADIFHMECGDRLIQRLPLHIVGGMTLGVDTADTSFRLGASLKGSSIIALREVTKKISTSYATSSTSMNISQAFTAIGLIDQTAFVNYTNELLSCLSAQSGTANAGACQQGLKDLYQAVNAASKQYQAKFVNENSPNWEKYFDVNYAHTITTRSLDGIPGMTFNTTTLPYQKYKAAILNNSNVLYDLMVANEIIKRRINPMLVDMFYPQGNTTNFLPTVYPSSWQQSLTSSFVGPQSYATLIAQYGLYSLGGDTLVNTTDPHTIIGGLNKKITDCTSATTPANVDQYCKLLAKNPSVDSVILDNYANYYAYKTNTHLDDHGFVNVTANGVNAIAQGLINTIHNLTYNVYVNGSSVSDVDVFSNYATSPVPSPYLASLVILPTTDTDGLILALPISHYNLGSSPYYTNGLQNSMNNLSAFSYGVCGNNYQPGFPSYLLSLCSASPNIYRYNPGFPGVLGVWQHYTTKNSSQLPAVFYPQNNGYSSSVLNTVTTTPEVLGTISGDLQLSGLATTAINNGQVMINTLNSQNAISAPYFTLGIGNSQAPTINNSILVVNIGNNNQCDLSEFGSKTACNYSIQVTDFFDNSALEWLYDDNMPDSTNMGINVTALPNTLEIQPIVGDLFYTLGHTSVINSNILPSGSWDQSCYQTSPYDGTTLEAKCYSSTDGSYTTSSVNVSSNGICINNNGNLLCGSSNYNNPNLTLPSGNWADSCLFSTYNSSKGTFSAYCEDVNGNYNYLSASSQGPSGGLYECIYKNGVLSCSNAITPPQLMDGCSLISDDGITIVASCGGYQVTASAPNSPGFCSYSNGSLNCFQLPGGSWLQYCKVTNYDGNNIAFSCTSTSSTGNNNEAIYTGQQGSVVSSETCSVTTQDAGWYNINGIPEFIPNTANMTCKSY